MPGVWPTNRILYVCVCVCVFVGKLVLFRTQGDCLSECLHVRGCVLYIYICVCVCICFKEIVQNAFPAISIAYFQGQKIGLHFIEYQCISTVDLKAFSGLQLPKPIRSNQKYTIQLSLGNIFRYIL